MEIAYAPQAIRDIEEILASTRMRSPSGATTLLHAIERAVEFCAEYPRTGGRTNRTDTFRRALGKYRYTIFYRIVRGDLEIEILRVVRSSRVRNLEKVPETD